MIAANMANLTHGGQGGNLNQSIDGLKPITQPAAAKMMNVSVPSITRAKKVINNAVPVLQSMVTGGDGFRWNQFIN